MIRGLPSASGDFQRRNPCAVSFSGNMPVPQLTLFDPGERLLADDERGRITYIPGLIDPATAAAWFAELRDAVTWRSERRKMYDREVDVPRLIGTLSAGSAVGVDADAHLPGCRPDRREAGSPIQQRRTQSVSRRS